MACRDFVFDQNIIRPADTVAYAIGDLINTAVAAPGLISLDFKTIGLEPNKKISITKVAVTSSNGAAATQLVPIVQLFTKQFVAANTVGSTGLGDNVTFKPLSNMIQGLDFLSLNLITNPIHVASQAVAGGFYGYKMWGLTEKIRLDSSAQLYLALIAGNAYTPISGESFEIKIEGTLQTD